MTATASPKNDAGAWRRIIEFARQLGPVYARRADDTHTSHMS